MKKERKQQRINELAWEIVEYFFPPSNKGKELAAWFEDLEQGLMAVRDKIRDERRKS